MDASGDDETDRTAAPAVRTSSIANGAEELHRLIGTFPGYVRSLGGMRLTRLPRLWLSFNIRRADNGKPKLLDGPGPGIVAEGVDDGIGPSHDLQRVRTLRRGADFGGERVDTAPGWGGGGGWTGTGYGPSCANGEMIGHGHRRRWALPGSLPVTSLRRRRTTSSSRPEVGSNDGRRCRVTNGLERGGSVKVGS
jgi:hypothetical protein